MNNYLLPILESYFAEILVQESKMRISQSFLTTKRDDIEKENREHRSLYSAITSYRDLTQLDGGDNLYCPNHSYSMSVDDMENHIADIVSHQCCFAVTQGYEAFESFLIDILTQFLFANQERLEDLKLPGGSIFLPKETIRGEVKKRQEVNNKGLLAMMRKISLHFRDHESNNIHRINVCHWFEMLSQVRHSVIHNRQVMSSRLLKYLDSRNANAMFDRHFKRKKIDGQIRVFLQPDVASDILNWLNSFAHFIFISLSKEVTLSLEVSTYTPPPIERIRII